MDQNFLFDMTFEASFIDDFYQELHKFEYLEESSTDESSSAEWIFLVFLEFLIITRYKGLNNLCLIN